MIIKVKFIKKFTAIVANLSLLLNTFLPFVLSVKPAYAEEPTPTPTVEIVENIPTPEITETPIPTEQPEIIPTETPEITPTEPPEATPSAQITETPTQTESQPIIETPLANQQSENALIISVSPTTIPTSTPIPTIQTGTIETTVVENNMSRTDLLNPSLSTDKSDYAPTEMALISGKNFLSNTEYLLIITSDDLEEKYNINTDSEGNFSYSYQLDGNYRPVYQVVVKDNNQQIVATTSFLDHQNFSVKINNDAESTTSQTVTINMSWATPSWPYIDPTYVRFVNVSANAPCPWSINSSWSDWQPLTDSGSNTASKTWQLRPDYGVQRVCVQTAHGLGILIESAFDNIEYKVPDATSPTITPNINPVPNVAGWNNSDVTLNWSVVDNESAITSTSGCGPISINSETTGNTYTCTATSTGGTETRSVTIKLDKTAPVITLDSYSTNPTNQDIIVTANTSIDSSLNATSYTFTENGSFTFTATDIAGNVTNETVNITNIDKNAPIVGAISISPSTINATGLVISRNSTISAPVSDVGLGIDPSSCRYSIDGGLSNFITVPNAYNSTLQTCVFENIDTANATGIAISVSDLAGNFFNTTNSWFNNFIVDLDIPTATFIYSTTEPTNGNVTVTLVPSEPVTITYPIDGSTSHIFTDNGSFTFTFIDSVGNNGFATATVNNIDRTAPTASVSYSTTSPTNQPVVATINPSENITVTNNSGLSYSFTDNGSFTFEFIDSAGNTGSIIATVANIDKTLPIITYTGTNPAGGLTNQNDQTFTVKTNEEVQSCTLNFNGNYLERQVTNDLSNGSGFTYITGGDDNATNYVLPFNFNFYGQNYTQLSVSSNAFMNFNSTNDASYPGSVAELQSKTSIATLWTDLVTSVYAKSESDNVRFRWTGYGWSTGGSLINEAVLRSNGQIELHYGDVYLPGRTITAGLSAGNGTDYVVSSINGQSSISPVSFAYSPGASDSFQMIKNEDDTYSVTVSDIADGNVNYSVTCKDLANNEGTSESKSMIIDTQAPILSEKTEFGDTWYNTDQTSSFYFSDVNGVASGNNRTCVISTEGPNQTCTINDLNVCDSAGNCNTELVTSDGANIDKINPVINIFVTPEIPDGQNTWYWTQPEISAVAIDSNLTTFEYQWDSELGDWTNYNPSLKPSIEGIHTLYFRAKDLAGHTTIVSKEIKWDKTDPELGPQNLSANPNPTSGSTSKIKWDVAKDNIGIDKYEIQWKLNGSNANYYSKTVGAGVTGIEIDQLTEGRWTVKVIAFDQSGKTKDASIDVNVDRSDPNAPTLTLTGTSAGTATLSWNAISDAKDYIIWYGSTPGVHEFGARVGNVTSYTVQGLGAGNYYFIIKAVDEAQNQSSDSNEVNTGNIAGANGTIPGQPAEGFSPEVLGDTTDESTSSIETKEGDILGILDKDGFSWWWLLLLLIIPLYVGGKKVFKKRK